MAVLAEFNVGDYVWVSEIGSPYATILSQVVIADDFCGAKTLLGATGADIRLPTGGRSSKQVLENNGLAKIMVWPQ